MMKKIMFEKTFSDEEEAHRSRRSFIARGFRVSLVAFDPSRNVHVFDVLW